MKSFVFCDGKSQVKIWLTPKGVSIQKFVEAPPFKHLLPMPVLVFPFSKLIDAAEGQGELFEE